VFVIPTTATGSRRAERAAGNGDELSSGEDSRFGGLNPTSVAVADCKRMMAKPDLNRG